MPHSQERTVPAVLGLLSFRVGNPRGAYRTKGRIANCLVNTRRCTSSTLHSEDAAINDKIAKHHGLLGSTQEIKLDHWGRRQLAYKIGTRETGYYVVARFHAESKRTLPEFERALKLDDGVMRYLISLHEHELGAPPMTEEQLAARKQGDDDDDDED